MKLRSLITAVLILSLIPIKAQAVENGVDATGNSFVVPIKFDVGNGRWSGCSGTLIAPRIVVTAGHCVLDSNGLLTKNVYVGYAGSSASSVTINDKIAAVQITSSFQNGANGKVGDDDLAFLTLSKSQSLSVPIILASEKQITDLRTSGASLKSIGYGRYSNLGTEEIIYPKSFDGKYDSSATRYSNSAWMTSTAATSCTGDSGAPILSISATQVTLVGVLTGTARGDNDNCGQKQSDGNYYTLFTLVGRYANLAFSAATDVMNSQDALVKSQMSQISELENQLATSSSEAIDARSLLEEANKVIAELKSKLPQTISCTKGKVVKKVTAVDPKCPSGYKIKR